MMQERVYFLTEDYELIDTAELYHHGVKGQKWGVRRYRNKDGSLTAAGKRRKQQNGKTASKIKKGRDFVSKIDGRRVVAVISATAAVASGALWAASAFMPNTAGITFARGTMTALTASFGLADAMRPSRVDAPSKNK